MARPTYYPRYSTPENVVTNTTMHLLSQVYQHSPDILKAVLSELLGDAEMPLGVDFQQQTRSETSVPDGRILQEPVHIVLETKVDAAVNIEQLIQHCKTFEKGAKGNFLLLLTKEAVQDELLDPVRLEAQGIGAKFRNITFEHLCDGLGGLAKEHETHLKLVIEDYLAYCADMGLLPDRRKWLRIVPCGTTFDLNNKYHLYYQPTDRGYSAHQYLGIYTEKAVRLLGRVSAVYDNQTSENGQMDLSLVQGDDRPEFRQRIKGMVDDSKEMVGWEIENGHRFFCAEQFLPTEFKKTSWGGIQGARFWDITGPTTQAANDSELAELLRQQTWE